MCISIEFFQQMWQGEKFFFCMPWLDSHYRLDDHKPEPPGSFFALACCNLPRSFTAQKQRLEPINPSWETRYENQGSSGNSMNIMAHHGSRLGEFGTPKSHKIPSNPMVYPHFSIFFHQKLQIWGRHPSPFYPFWANPSGALAGCTVTSIEASGWRCPGGIADEWLEDSLCWLPLRSFEWEFTTPGWRIGDSSRDLPGAQPWQPGCSHENSRRNKSQRNCYCPQVQSFFPLQRNINLFVFNMDQIGASGRSRTWICNLD